MSVAGFKAIYGSGVITLGPLTVLIGRNGVGKSSFVESIQWLQECAALGIQHATAKRFHGFDELVNRRTTGIRLQLVLDAGGREVRYRVFVKDGVVQSETCYEGRTRGAKQTIWSRKGRRGPAVRTVADGSVVRVGDQLALAVASGPRAAGAEQLGEWLRSAVFLRLSPTRMAQTSRLDRPPSSPILEEDGGNLPALLRDLTAAQLGEVVARVREVIDGARALAIRYQGEEGTFTLAEQMTSRGGMATYEIPAWLLSEGTRRITAIFALLVHPRRPSLLVIEEIENGFDPWTLATLFQHLRAASADGVQLILTTHSPYLLDHVEPDEVLVVQRVSGNTQLLRAPDLKMVKANAGASPTGAMYLAGYLEAPSPGAK
jgi:predicted ATPase